MSFWRVELRSPDERVLSAKGFADRSLAHDFAKQLRSRVDAKGQSVHIVRNPAGGEPEPDAVDNPPKSRLLKELEEWYGKPSKHVTELAKRLEAARPRDVEDIMREVDKEVRTHGVEAIRDPDGEVIAEYLNTGDTYDPTLVYDVKKHTFHITSWGDFYEQWERDEALRRRDDLRQYRDEIIESMARSLWVSAYADWADGAMSEDGERPEGAERPGGGEAWEDYAPETPAAVLKAAEDIAVQIELENGEEITGLLWRAANADMEADENAGGADGLRDYFSSDYAEEFGGDLGMMVLGHGVGWFDDHAEFLHNPAHVEIYTFDGETVETSGIGVHAPYKSETAVKPKRRRPR